MTVKERLHQVIDRMSDDEAEATLRRIDTIRDNPLVEFLDAAPIDNEPVTDEERAAVAEADAEHAAGAEGIPLDEIKRRYDAA
jgi:hypothetical protein